VAGVRRKGELSMMVNWLPSGELSHGAVSGLLQAWADGSKDGYEIDYPDGSLWLFSGFVIGIAPKAPVDGAFEATINIRPSGGQIFLP
jgi:hypothetical protein